MQNQFTERASIELYAESVTERASTELYAESVTERDVNRLNSMQNQLQNVHRDLTMCVSECC